jgi:hypothetical protein
LIGNRNLKIEDSNRGLSLQQQTPTGIFFGGLETFLQKNISLGLEASLRSSLISNTPDKNSLDLTFRLDTYF